MRLVCPSCGALHSAEAWQNDAACRQFMDVLMRLPGPVQVRALPYLGLFRKGDRGLSWPRALRIVSELESLVSKESVKWEDGETRPASAHLWADAMDATLTRRPKGLSNHNYLRHVCWEMAGATAARVEQNREHERQSREHVEAPGDDEERRNAVLGMVKEFTKKHGI